MQQDTVQVQRIGIFTDIQESLRELEQATAPPFAEIINLYGLPGIGKTFLMRQIFDHFQADYPIIWLDFDTSRDSPVQPISQPLDRVLADLMQHVPALVDLPATLEVHDTTRPSSDYEVRFAAEFLDLQSLTSERQAETVAPHTLLLIDHVDHSDYWKWVQREVIRPLVLNRQKTLVVCVSQTPLFWHYQELRDLCTLLETRPFSEQETLDYFRQNEQELLAASAHALTRGYPLQLEQLRPFFLLNYSGGNAVNQQETIDLEAILHSLSWETRRMLRHVGLVRSIDVNVLQRLLTELAPDWLDLSTPHRVRQIFLSHVLPELNQRGHLEPYSRGQPPRLKRTLSRACEENMRQALPYSYERTCMLLDQIYYDHFYARPIDHTPAFNEWLYFSTVPLVYQFEYADRNAWHARLTSLFERARLVGRKLAMLLYRDREVMQRLQALQLLRPLQDLMLDYFGNDPSVPPLLNDTELARYRRRLINYWSVHPQLAAIGDDIPNGLFTLLQVIATLGFAFTLPALHTRLNQRFGTTAQIEPEVVQRAVALMQTCGLLTYDHEQGIYQLTNQVYPLITPMYAGITTQPPSAAEQTHSS